MKRFYTFLIALHLIMFLTACTGSNSAVEQPKEIESGIQEGQMFFMVKARSDPYPVL